MKHTLQQYFPALKDAYLVGGCVRDLFLDRSPTDFDMVVLKDPEGAAKTISAHTHGHLIRLGKPGFILYRIILDHAVIDVQSAKGHTIEEDLRQRDFTINAMAYPTASGEVIDIHGGRTDLKNRIVRMTSEDVFKTDPVRLIRAHRLAAVLKFDIDPLTLTAIKKNSDKIRTSAGERIREELFQMLRVDNVHTHLMDMAESDLLFAIFPGLSSLKGCTQNRFHTEDVLAHNLSTIGYMDHIFATLKGFQPNLFHRLADRLDDHSRVLLKFSALMHDIGKPSSKSIDENGDTHFYGHEKVGVKIIGSVFGHLKLSNHDARFIEHMVRNHLSPLQLFQSEKQRRLTPKGVARFFMKNGEMTPFVLLHALADQMAKEKKEDHRYRHFISKLLEDFFSRFKTIRHKPKLVSGNDLIREFGLSPSPLFKTILTRIEEKRLSEEITTKAEALSQVRQYLRSKDLLSGS
ncbi:MAG TPA: CCA tRNA nucleotidyltransferase [Deltaproteobacteria bacterium]|nr:CCA tRNA nucleotidyltransferase [Deltaproteobacteria bacterium]